MSTPQKSPFVYGDEAAYAAPPEVNRLFKVEDDLPLLRISDDTTIGDLRKLLRERYPAAAVEGLATGSRGRIDSMAGMSLCAALTKYPPRQVFGYSWGPASSLLVREIIAALFPEEYEAALAAPPA